MVSQPANTSIRFYSQGYRGCRKSVRLVSSDGGVGSERNWYREGKWGCIVGTEKGRLAREGDGLLVGKK